MTNALKVKATTWLLKTSDDYDYQSSYKRTNLLTLKSSTTLYRVGKDVIALPLGCASTMVPTGAVALASLIVHGDSAMLLGNPQIKIHDVPSSPPLWLVVQRLKQEKHRGYLLSEGDVIRMGGKKWLVTEISVPNTKSVKTQDSIIHPEQVALGISEDVLDACPQVTKARGLSSDGEQWTADQVCKVCLSDQFTEDNPLIAPCICNGTVKYIHVNCLGELFASKRRNFELTFAKIYSWTGILCTVCKVPLPMGLEVDGKRFKNIGVPKPQGGFIALKDMKKESAHPEIQMWQWNGQNAITIGNRDNYEVTVDDSLMSEEHARLRIINGQVYLQDCDSVYGTLVLLQKPVILSPGSDLTVQNGNTVLKFSIKKKHPIFSCFSRRRRFQTFSENDFAEDIRQLTTCHQRVESEPACF